VGSALLFLFTLAMEATADPAVGRLNHAGYRHLRHCTAVLVAPRVALTAAHCLEGLDVTKSHLLLGYDRGNWLEHLEPEVMRFLGGDLAALCLGKPAQTSPLPLAARPAQLGETLAIAGYGRPRVHAQQERACRVTSLLGERGIWLDCPSPPGNSGGPVLRSVDGRESVVAVAVASNSETTLALVVPPGDLASLCASD